MVADVEISTLFDVAVFDLNGQREREEASNDPAQ